MAIDIRARLRPDASVRDAIGESIARLANPFGALADPVPWYVGFVRDRDALRGDFWNAIATYTVNADDGIPGQERLFDPDGVGA
jgi:hypothetical protein